MSAFLIGLLGLGLEALLLIRAIRGKTLREFPLFWSYVLCVFTVDVIRDVTYTASPGSYYVLYWLTQFLSLLVGYGVILEIVQRALAHYPGAERVARAVVFMIFLGIFSYVLIESGTKPHWSPGSTYGELERDLRAVQALVLAGILGVVFYYGIELSRNLKAIILGYGLFIASSVLALALRAYTATFIDSTWRWVLQYSFLVSLVIWTWGLWSASPKTVVRSEEMERDYESLALRTKAALERLRSEIERTARS